MPDSACGDGSDFRADARVVRIRLDQLSLQRPRQWGGCWLALERYRPFGLDTFFAEHLPASRKWKKPST